MWVYATLFWRDGCIEADINIPGILEQYRDQLELRGRIFSDADAAALVGSPLASINELSLDAEGTVTKATPLNHEGVRLYIRTERKLVNCSTGRIWAR